jgi:hypothetical protein
MKKVEHNLKVGDKLYYSDSPETFAGEVIKLTPKRDVVIRFHNGEVSNYPAKIAVRFIVK